MSAPREHASEATAPVAAGAATYAGWGTSNNNNAPYTTYNAANTNTSTTAPATAAPTTTTAASTVTPVGASYGYFHQHTNSVHSVGYASDVGSVASTTSSSANAPLARHAASSSSLTAVPVGGGSAAAAAAVPVAQRVRHAAVAPQSRHAGAVYTSEAALAATGSPFDVQTHTSQSHHTHNNNSNSNNSTVPTTLSTPPPLPAATSLQSQPLHQHVAANIQTSATQPLSRPLPPPTSSSQAPPQPSPAYRSQLPPPVMPVSTSLSASYNNNNNSSGSGGGGMYTVASYADTDARMSAAVQQQQQVRWTHTPSPRNALPGGNVVVTGSDGGSGRVSGNDSPAVTFVDAQGIVRVGGSVGSAHNGPAGGGYGVGGRAATPRHVLVMGNTPATSHTPTPRAGVATSLAGGYGDAAAAAVYGGAGVMPSGGVREGVYSVGSYHVSSGNSSNSSNQNVGDDDGDKRHARASRFGGLLHHISARVRRTQPSQQQQQQQRQQDNAGGVSDRGQLLQQQPPSFAMDDYYTQQQQQQTQQSQQQQTMMVMADSADEQQQQQQTRPPHQTRFGHPEDDLPLLDELGIVPRHIAVKARAVLNPFQAMPVVALHDTDLAGPAVFAVALACLLSLQGKMQFSAIYGLCVLGVVLFKVLLSLMHDTAVPVAFIMSALGYGLLPSLLLACLRAVQYWVWGVAPHVLLPLALLVVVWSSWCATALLVAGHHMMAQRYLVLYPVLLFYAIFAALTIF